MIRPLDIGTPNSGFYNLELIFVQAGKIKKQIIYIAAHNMHVGNLLVNLSPLNGIVRTVLLHIYL